MILVPEYESAFALFSLDLAATLAQFNETTGDFKSVKISSYTPAVIGTFNVLESSYSEVTKHLMFSCAEDLTTS